MDAKPDMQWYGAPRTVAFCVTDAGMGRIHVATSKYIWPPKSFLLCWVVKARKSRFASEGVQASEALIREVGELAVSSKMTDKQAVLKIAFAKEVTMYL